MKGYVAIVAMVVGLIGCVETEDGSYELMADPAMGNNGGDPTGAEDKDEFDPNAEFGTPECQLNSRFGCTCYGVKECDDGSDCLRVDGMSTELGVCSTIAPDGSCNFPERNKIKAIMYDPEHCVVACADDRHCPGDQSCRQVPGTPMQLCYPGEVEADKPEDDPTTPPEGEPGTPLEDEPQTEPGTGTGAETGTGYEPGTANAEPKCEPNSGFGCSCEPGSEQCRDGSYCAMEILGQPHDRGLCVVGVDATGECPDTEFEAYSDDVVVLGGAKVCALVCERDDECPAEQKCRPLPDASGWNICHP